MVDAAPRAPLHVAGPLPGDDVEAVVGADLHRLDGDDLREPAEEELRVAAEVLAEAAASLLEARAHVREVGGARAAVTSAMGHVASAVPLAVVTTDRTGTITEANPAAGHLLATPFPRLRGKPLMVFVTLGQRRLARRLVSEAARLGGVRGRLRVVPRSGGPVVVDAVAVAAETESLQWVLVPSAETDAASDAQARSDEGTAERGEPTTATGHDGPEAMRAIAELCQLQVGPAGVRAVLDRAAVLATRAVPGAEHASVCLGDPLAPCETASSSAAAQRLDGLQLAAGHGPSATAWAEGTACGARPGEDDAPAAAPVVEPRAAAVDGCSAIAVPVCSGTETFGVLTVYGKDPDLLDTDVARDRVAVFASAVAALVDHARHAEDLRLTAEQLESALTSRAGIEQAKGMVAAWLGCSVDAAFEALSRLSQDRNVKLREVAGFVVADPQTARLILTSRAERS